MSFWNPYKWRTAVAWVNPSAQAEDHQTDEGSIKTPAFVETAAADGWLLLDEEFGLVQNGESSAGREIAKKIGSERNGNGVGLCLTKELESMDWKEMLSALPEDLDLFSQQHPLDPHKPNYSPLLPEALRPYPSFEGWYVRVSDPSNGLSIALIMATNYVTDESQITLLFSPASSVDNHGNEDAKDDGDAVKSGYTYAVVVRTKVSNSFLSAATSNCLVKKLFAHCVWSELVMRYFFCYGEGCKVCRGHGASRRRGRQFRIGAPRV